MPFTERASVTACGCRQGNVLRAQVGSARSDLAYAARRVARKASEKNVQRVQDCKRFLAEAIQEQERHLAGCFGEEAA